MADDAGDVELAEEFAEIAKQLQAGEDVQATLDRIVGLAVEMIDSCEHAGLSLVVGRKITSPASTSRIPTLVDRLQTETNEGPCLDAIRDEALFQTGCLSDDQRWPEFVARATAESGVESILAIRLFVHADTMGALNLYSNHIDAFTDHDVAVGAIFATHAAVALAASERAENLKAAVSTRQVIGEATGMLMARQNVSRSEAFNMLRRASQRLNIKLRDVAERVVNQPPPSPKIGPDA